MGYGQGWHDGSPYDAGAPRAAHGKSSRRAHTDSGIVCSCARTGGGSHAHARGRRAATAGGSSSTGGSMNGPVNGSMNGPMNSSVFALAIDGHVDDLSRHGLFLRTPQTLPPGTSATVCLELPGDRVCLRAQVVRVERGARSGIGVRFVAEQPSRLQVANYLMRCHAYGT